MQLSWWSSHAASDTSDSRQMLSRCSCHGSPTSCAFEVILELAWSTFSTLASFSSTFKSAWNVPFSTGPNSFGLPQLAAAPPRDGSAAGVGRRSSKSCSIPASRVPKRVLHQRFYASRGVVRHRQLQPREAGRASDAGIMRGASPEPRRPRPRPMPARRPISTMAATDPARPT